MYHATFVFRKRQDISKYINIYVQICSYIQNCTLKLIETIEHQLVAQITPTTPNNMFENNLTKIKASFSKIDIQTYRNVMLTFMVLLIFYFSNNIVWVPSPEYFPSPIFPDSGVVFEFFSLISGMTSCYTGMSTMDWCMDVCMYGCMYVCTDGWMDACMDGWLDGWMERCMDVWMHGWMNVWMYGCMDV